jgi:dihydrofolate reductase
MKHFQAIAAMSQNRVIGNGSRIPWHLPEDFKWFKQRTMGHVLVMGRKTFESIGGEFSHPDVRIISNLAQIDLEHEAREVFICGGGEIYALALPQCSDLYLTLVKREVEGDVFFPPFEQTFQCEEILLERPEFEVRRYRNKTLRPV